jgi:hypothetical protein
MNWEYRIVKDNFGQYVVREVKIDPEGKVINYSFHNIWPTGWKLEQIKRDLEKMLAACDLGFLELRDIEGCKDE